tara:strand:- start:71 stop:586 length:516 start_codon:yes stop_codon:yes gene_type:complete
MKVRVRIDKQYVPTGGRDTCDRSLFRGIFFTSKDEIVQSVAKKRGLSEEYITENFSKKIDEIFEQKLESFLKRKVFDDFWHGFENILRDGKLTPASYEESWYPSMDFDNNGNMYLKHNIDSNNVKSTFPFRRGQSFVMQPCLDRLKNMGFIDIEFYSDDLGVEKTIKVIYT